VQVGGWMDVDVNGGVGWLASLVSCWPAGSGYECISYMIIMLAAPSCNLQLQHALHLQFLYSRTTMAIGRWSMGLPV